MTFESANNDAPMVSGTSSSTLRRARVRGLLLLLALLVARLGGAEAHCTCPSGQATCMGACTDCAPGRWSDAQASSCTACAEGRYQNSWGQSSCKHCAKGDTTTTDGFLDREEACKKGEELVDCGGDYAGFCDFCAVGKYRGQAERNDNANALDKCASCAAGKFHDMEHSAADQGATGGKVCKHCPTGQYQPQEGQIDCLPCEKHCGEGTFLDQCGATSAGTCAKCPQGKFRNGGRPSGEGNKQNVLRKLRTLMARLHSLGMLSAFLRIVASTSNSCLISSNRVAAIVADASTSVHLCVVVRVGARVRRQFRVYSRCRTYQSSGVMT